MADCPTVVAGQSQKSFEKLIGENLETLAGGAAGG